VKIRARGGREGGRERKMGMGLRGEGDYKKVAVQREEDIGMGLRGEGDYIERWLCDVARCD
jgi:hypothetical protein